MFVYLFFDGLDNFWMAMTNVTDSYTGDQIGIPLSIGSVQVYSFSAFNGNEVRRIGCLRNVVKKNIRAELHAVKISMNGNTETANERYIKTKTPLTGDFAETKLTV
jgi:hypothetical protein